MIIGKWNKSVILTYIGLLVSIIGMMICFSQDIVNIKYAFVCLIITGICDLFDGFVARKCKRNEEEKQFGVQLDSLVDVFDFMAFPIVLFISLGLTSWYHFIIYSLYAIFGVARLGYFNIRTVDSERAIDHYEGLPVTYIALILPLVNLLRLWLDNGILSIVFSAIMLIVAILFVLKVNIKKPRGIAYAIFSLLAISTIVIYVIFL